jgi:hypothetical protein
MVRKVRERINIMYWRKMLQAAVLAAFALIGSPLSSLSPVYAQYGPILNRGGPNQLCDLQDIMGHIIENVVVPIAAIVLFIMLILGGFQYLTSAGDPKATAQGSKTITYAVAGIALLLLAWFILFFIQEFTGVQVTIFNIPCPPEAG